MSRFKDLEKQVADLKKEIAELRKQVLLRLTVGEYVPI